MRSPEVVLKDAAALIEQRGWYQGGSRGPNGELCIVSAIVETSGLSYAAERLVLVRIGGRSGDGSIFKWNDAPGRTKAEVLAILRGDAHEVA